MKKIMLDVDGVVADIHTPLCEIMGLDIAKWTPGEYWFEKAFGISTASVWEHPKIKAMEFWADAPKTPWADQLVKYLITKGDVCFLTKPVREPSCLQGKAIWLKKHFPHIPFLIGTEKRFCAHSNAVLVDDYDKNVEEFESAGGRGVLFPRIWNSLNRITSPMPYMLAMFE